VTEKFGIGSMGMGSLSGMLDTMEAVKRAWSSFSLPPNLAPTLDVDELDRRIADLKAVEQWLAMNLNMLQGTIKTLEVQRGTLAALQAFGQAMSGPADPGAFAAQAMTALQRGASGASSAKAGDSWPGAAGAAAAPAAPAASGAERGATAPGTAQGPGTSAPGATVADEMSRAAAAAVNPGAWWNLLQSQFEQVAQAALAGTGLAGDPQTPPPPTGGAGKPAARSGSRAGTGAAKRGSKAPAASGKARAKPRAG